ncbi:hypothetical protein HDV01_006599 [Terramyces sp. JEL0728]|nr:hypothetical protein HDV01_006599 [Terramyces sp. JEL0728]
MSSYNGIPLTAQSIQSLSLYVATDYHIDDTDAAYMQQNATVNDCMTMCAQNDGVYFLCTAFSFHSSTCYFLDRPINTYTTAKNVSNSFGFVLDRNKNCKDSGGVTCQSLPNVSSQSKPSSTSNYQGISWGVSNGWYNAASCKGSTNPIQVYTGTISDSECKDDCCTSYAYSNPDSTCVLYDLNLDTIRFAKDTTTCGFKLSKSQNCYDDGKSVTCQGYSSSSSVSNNPGSNSTGGSNTGMIAGIAVAAVVVVLFAGFFIYRRRKSLNIEKASEDQKAAESLPPQDRLPVEQEPKNQYFNVTLPPASRTDSKSTAVASTVVSVSPKPELQYSLPPAIAPHVQSELPILQPAMAVPTEVQPPIMSNVYAQGQPAIVSISQEQIQPPILSISQQVQPPVIGIIQPASTPDGNQPPVIAEEYDAQPPKLP